KLLKVEKQWHDFTKISPVRLIIGLQHEQATSHERPMHQRQKLRRQQPAVQLGGIAIRLRMVQMYLRDASRSNILCEKFVRANDGQADIRQTALIGPARRVAD